MVRERPAPVATCWIADVARPGEVLASEAVVEAAEGRFAFERIDEASLKGLPSPVPLYRVSRSVAS